MEARYVANAGLETLLDPDAAVWRKARAEQLKLVETPLGLQPTDAIRTKWANRKYGQVGSVSVSALHDGQVLALRLEWAEANRSAELTDTTVFPDAAAVAFPLADGAPLVTMGAPGSAINAWYWRADESEYGRDVVAEGIGTSRTVDQQLVRTNAKYEGGHWKVVMARPLRVDSNEPLVQLAAGEPTLIGVAVWEGANGERAGIKAFSGDWTDLTLDAASAARS